MRSQARKDAVALASLFGAALALRAAFWALTARSTAASPLNLSLFFDGHLYMIVAKSFPWAYARLPELFPMFRSGVYFANRYPVYPFLIWAAGGLLGDPRAGALAVSQLAGSATAALAYLIAKECSIPRPWLPAVLLCFFPPTWLLTSTLAFTESVFVLLLTGALYAHLKRRDWTSAMLAGLAAVAQKSGFLMLALLLGLTLRRHGLRSPRKLIPLLLAGLPLLALHAWFYRVFGEALADLRVEREVFADSFFTYPFHAIAAGLAAPEQIFSGHFFLRKALLGSSCLFYLFALGVSRRGKGEAAGTLRLWLGAALLFNLCLNGMWAYLGFPRFMTAAAPAAILLLAGAARSLSLRSTAALLALALPVSFAAALFDARSGVELTLRWWSEGYFSSLLHYLLLK